MSQNDEYLNRTGVTKCSCSCTLIFQFDNVSISSTVPIPYKTLNEIEGLCFFPFHNLKLFCQLCCSIYTFLFRSPYKPLSVDNLHALPRITTVGYLETWLRKRNNSSSFSSSFTDLWYNYFGRKLFMMINMDIKEYCIYRSVI
jgi:hypothetical protein